MVVPCADHCFGLRSSGFFRISRIRISDFAASAFLSLFLAASAFAQDHADARAPGSGPALSVPKDLPRDAAHTLPPRNWIDQTQAEADLKSRGCLECHAGSEPMHSSKNVVLGCIDCHGGNATPALTQAKAHVTPRNPLFWQSSANPNDSKTYQISRPTAPS